MVMKELKDIANYFQTEILDYIPGELSFCIKPDFVWTVINGYHGRIMWWPYVLKERNGRTIKLNILKGLIPDEELEKYEENGYELFVKGRLHEYKEYFKYDENDEYDEYEEYDEYDESDEYDENDENDEEYNSVEDEVLAGALASIEEGRHN